MQASYDTKMLIGSSSKGTSQIIRGERALGNSDRESNSVRQIAPINKIKIAIEKTATASK